MDNSSIPSLDFARFEELSDGDPGGLRELIQLYLVKTTEQMNELKSAIDSGASANVSRIAHSLVGANAMVGMDTLIPILRSLESHGEKKQLAEAKKVFADLEGQYHLIQDQLQKKLASLSPS